MEELKKNLFWIILAVVVVGAVGAWYSVTPSVEESKTAALSTADSVKNLAEKSNKPGIIKNDQYIKAAKDYMKELDAQKAALLKKWEGQKLDVRLKDAPGKDKPSIEFDSFISKMRGDLVAKMKAAGVQPPANFDQLTFADSGVDDKSAEIKRHREYRLRYMAVLDEVIDALCSKPGSVNVAVFETDPDKPEAVQPQPAGPIALTKFAFNLPENDAKAAARDFEKALQLSGKKTAGPSTQTNTFKGSEVPLSVSSVDVEFLSHISAVPAVIRKMESTSRYFAIVNKADFERASPLFPAAARDTKDPLYKAAFVPAFNTHYGEGPVRVIVSFDIIEYDKKKADEFEKAAPVPPKPAPKK